MHRLCTDAWLLRGISSFPGELRLHAGRLAFVVTGPGSAWPFQVRRLAAELSQPGLAKALVEGAAFQLFEWPVHQVQVGTPWYYFGGGLTLRHQGINLRFSFGRPAANTHHLAAAAAELGEIGVMRNRGRLWATALAKVAARR